MDSTQEQTNKKVLDSIAAFLVECNRNAMRKGQYCDTIVRITHQGGTIVEYETSNPQRVKVK